MSMLLFYVGENCYVIDSRHVLRIIPKVRLKKLPSEPFYVAGLLNLADQPLRVIDFCQLIEQRDTRTFLHSRIILIKDPHSSDQERIVGLLGEKVENLIHLKLEEFSQTTFPLQSFPYLDKIYSHDQQVIQYLNVEKFFHFLSLELFKATENENHGF